MSTTSRRKSKVERLSLAQVLAWIAWFDPNRSVTPSPLPEFAPGGRGQLAPELREWWNTTARHERELSAATGALANAITSEVLTVSGRLVEIGSPHGDVPKWHLHDPIPREVTRLPCQMPLEWLGSHGGWLIFIQGADNGLDVGPRFCAPTFDDAEVKRLWKQPRPDREELVRCMADEGRRYRAQTGRPAPRPYLIKHCIEKMGCTNDEAEAAVLRVPEELRRVRGRPKRRKPVT